ncbi:MAG: hypothetical protein FWD31_14540 [Planctomycetaceae bacterium]|nr:hypothetical protein [Planctomycetaceae bacterium]
MKSGSLNTIIAAVVGGVVGAVVAFACGAFSAKGLPETIDKLKVGELIVSEKMMLWKDGDGDASLLIQNGGILATGRIIASQLSGNTVVANAVLTTPDSPLSPLGECTIFTEMASSFSEGGMLTVRSPDGGNVLGNLDGIQSGLAYTVTYDSNSTPVCILRKNDDGQRFLGQFLALPFGQNGTIFVSHPLPPQQADPQVEMSPNTSAGISMIPNNATPTPGPTQVAPSPGMDHSAMSPTVIRQ